MGHTALDAKRGGDIFLMPPESLKIITDKSHPLYDRREDKLVNEGLVLSMKSAIGFIDPVTAYKDGPDVVVLDGRQRVKAAIEANRQLIAEGRPAIMISVLLKRGQQAELFAIQLGSNENRTDDGDLERAKNMARYMAFGRTEAEAGAIFGLTPVKARRVLSLLDLAPEVQKSVAAGRCSTSAAVQLVKLPREEQVKKLDEVLAAGPSERATVANVKKAVRPSELARPSKGEIRRVLAAAVRLEACPDMLDTLRWVALGIRPTAGPLLHAIAEYKP